MAAPLLYDAVCGGVGASLDRRACHWTRRVVDAMCFDALAQAVKAKVQGFKEQEISSTAWGFATAGRYDARLGKFHWGC